jgi:lipoprotein-anchoring transpeptidase ErfK/SrfK
MTRHRRHEVRPRYGRLAAAASSVTVTAVAVLGGAGTLPSAAVGEGQPVGVISTVGQQVPRAGDRPVPAAPSVRRSEPAGRSSAVPVPADSGTGRRVVFSEGQQRVWLVGRDDRVRRTYLVSGSLHDNLDPGSYTVYSRSQRAWGIDDSGTMRHFVRFAHGDNAAIGFHDIPVDDGRRVQTPSELGTPQSHGCIRQRRADAVALWEFAPLGTTVVVVS